MMNDVKCLLLLAKVYESHKKEAVIETLNKALDLQSRILKRVPLEQPEMIPSQKQLAASICIQFAEHYLAEKEYDKAVRSYKDVFSYLPTDNKVSDPQSKKLLSPSGHNALLSSLTRCRGQFLLHSSLRSHRYNGHGKPANSGLWGKVPAPADLGPHLLQPLEQGSPCIAKCEGYSGKDIAESHISLTFSSPPWRWGDDEGCSCQGTLGMKCRLSFQEGLEL